MTDEPVLFETIVILPEFRKLLPDCILVSMKQKGRTIAKEVAENDHKYYVLEISSFQLDDIINFAPKIGVITNITPDHLDSYDHDFSKYLKSKLRINQNQTERDFLLFNADDPKLNKAIKQIDTGEEILICYGPKFKLK